ncbi:MAG: MBOAT family protein [Eubacterium sp.]|nr:MBOAT family protein [Eubacterium sp.]
MSYQTASFLLFSLAVLIVYYLTPKRLQKYTLLAGSFVFYCILGVKYLPFIITTLYVSFFAGIFMGKIYQKADGRLAQATEMSEKKAIREKSKKHAKIVLNLSMIIPVALLVVCKYSNFFIKNVNAINKLIGLDKSFDVIKFVLPIGISFYTFMALSYMLDIYWKRYTYETNIINYAAYLMYFPHVVQGPIDRYNKFNDQIKNGVKFDPYNIQSGVMLIIWGFFKKLVIADRLAFFVDNIYNNYKDYHGFILVLATVAYSIQIYCDFSGCIDIVSGASEMFGIKLAENFNHPYFSRSMLEFWRRWHISLQEWFKDYIYFPVSMSGFVKGVKKNAKKKGHKKAGELFASCFPILIVWIITGIWHGSSWKYVAWGMFHAFLLISSKIFEDTNAKINKLLKVKTESWGFALFQMARTFALCCVGRVFFRANRFSDSIGIFRNMVNAGFGMRYLGSTQLVSYGLDLNNIFVVVVAIIILLAGDIMQEKMNVRHKLITENSFALRWVVILVGVFMVLIFGIYGPGYDASSFIYQEF